MRFAVMAAAVLVVSASVACGGDTPTSNTNNFAAQITVGDNYFTPNSVTVPPGATVAWIWGGAVGHNVIFSTAPTTPPGDCGLTSSGICIRAFPTTTGTYNYYCSLHGGMVGSITIQP